MTQNYSYTGPTARISETTSFGTHRNAERPASAMANGASSMPTAWKTKAAMPPMTERQGAEPARALYDIALDPLRWVNETRFRKLGFAIGAILVVVIVL